MTLDDFCTQLQAEQEAPDQVQQFRHLVELFRLDASRWVQEPTVETGWREVWLITRRTLAVVEAHEQMLKRDRN